MSGRDQTPANVPVAPMIPTGDHTQADFESTIQAYVAKTDADQVARIKDFMATTLQAECDKQDKAIKAAWETITRALETFNTNRDKLIDIMRREEGLRRTQKAVELGGLDKMVLPTYKKLFDEITTTRHRESDPMSPASLQAHSPGLSAISDSLMSPTNPAVSTTALVHETPQPVKYTAKRSLPNPDLSVTVPAPKRVKVDSREQSPAGPATASLHPHSFGHFSTNNPDVPGYNVEGKEFIFPFPMGSSSYYVLRCEGDKSVPAHTFKTHPLLSRHDRPAPAVEHYNQFQRCKGNHDGKRQYKIEEIVKRWGHRVTGVDVKEAWVNAANGRLRESESRKESVLDTGPTGPRTKNQGRGY